MRNFPLPLLFVLLGCSAVTGRAEFHISKASSARAVLAELVAIESTHSKGSTAAAQAIQARLLEAGFSPIDVELITPRADKGNLLVRYRGKGRVKPLLFIGHLDVVDARAVDWSVPPFELTEREGYLYGRGVEDMKASVSAAVANLVRLRTEGYIPDRDLYFAFTADEEAGGTVNGVDWLLSNKAELSNVAYVVNLESGGGESQHGRPMLLGIETSEKTYASYEIEATNPGGHSSLPVPENAIYQLAQGLLRIGSLRFPLQITPTIRRYFEGFSTTQSGEIRLDMLAISRDGDAAAAARVSNVAAFNALLRTTCVATLLQAGHAENALPQRARATIQCRLMPGESPEAVREVLVGTLADPALQVRIKDHPLAAPATEPSPEVFRVVSQISHTLWPGVPVVPIMSAGASDNVYSRRIGIPTFGIDGLFIDIDDHRLHGRDERIRVSAFDAEVDFQYRLFRRLADSR